MIRRILSALGRRLAGIDWDAELRALLAEEGRHER